ncbi:glycosyltransferase [Aquella oligotrophica]|uniref:Glycosyltransferase 2-like domain-containing protein n=1 Tax=Aquella oligotrophica TaxID=2067065 RepID=A0A2I7N553_9NEIS|nr:glycosyltransferase [Aquella oligotrophica]AUR51597.1 hypothetical protein CUN60_04595 [Aquella oligotrophica]
MCVISVIVPVYNTENYLRRCLDSLVNQTLADIEIIVVNDSSPDYSQQIIDEYVSNYPKQVKSFIKPNGGLSSTRNFGVTKACGNYISFVDSDDWVDFNLYQIMYAAAIKDNCDIVCCDFIEKYSGFELIRSVIPENNYGNRYIGNVIACNKIYRRQFWQENGFNFFHGIYHEDLELIPRVLLASQKTGYINSSYYYYEKTNSSAITSGNILHIEVFPLICERLVQFNSNHNSEFEVFIADLAYIYIMQNKDSTQSQQFFLLHKKLFRLKVTLKLKRKIMIILLRFNFKLFHKLNQYVGSR